MTKNELEPKAVAYTKSLSDGKRGLREASRGLWQRSIPAFVGYRELRVATVVAAAASLLMVFASALFPMVTKKMGEAQAATKPTAVAVLPTKASGPVSAASQPDLILSIDGINFSRLDVVLLFIAVALAIIPKWVERVRSKSNEISRSRAMENLVGGHQ
jgi:hypothetical protein